MKLRNIEILESDPNRKGDLFGRLMSDLFHTLGYHEARVNIHKSGREIDLNSLHRTEPKMAIGECKAIAEKVGGSEINKFIGALDAEKRKISKDKKLKKYNIIGYFISLSGFKETAIEQEDELENKRVILIKADKIVDELIEGRILISPAKAISSLSFISDRLTLLHYYDLLAYNKGWIWAFYYSDSNGQKASHVAFVHAEGKPLIHDLANEVISIDLGVSNLFDGLILLNKEQLATTNQQTLKWTTEKYFKYLQNELGEIQFEGLPTDKEAGTVKVKLESIFIPLHLTNSKLKKEGLDFKEPERMSIGDILEQKSKLAILAKPGGGKSTLLKRIAIAYAFPERRKQINDKLPDRNWFPIFLRCRELAEKVTLSITEIISNIPARAEMPSCIENFGIITSNALQNGTALLLIDGLDEISEDKQRIAFVNQLRTFIATYPTINIIVTSREAGFRVVAGSLATYCENFVVSSLNQLEIQELCLKWHKAIIDDSENTTKEADKLATVILKDSRIKVLAGNPLLLTTLLFVKRWAGYLPTKRSVLYQEMIKLLLVTWNVEGHEILDIEEAEPQLAYVAYWMTKNGQQTISATELNSCLVNARKEMPEILGYTKVSPPEFIKRVELRSSLLIMSGHTRLNSGNVTQVYEFLHLSFQEYLTAKAIVKHYIPQTDISNKVVDILKPNINKENWKEVIPLTAVLLERDTKELIEYLISESKKTALSKVEELTREERLAPTLLGTCLANEIQIMPELLETAIEWYAKNYYTILDKGTTEIILNNKFGIIFRDKVKDLYSSPFSDQFSRPLGSLLAAAFDFDLSNNINDIKNLELIRSDSKKERNYATIGLMVIAWKIVVTNFSFTQTILDAMKELNPELLKLLNKNDKVTQFSICWYLAFAVKAKLVDQPFRQSFAIKLVKLWTKAAEPSFKKTVSWALTELLTTSLPKNELSKIPKLKIAVHETYRKPSNEHEALAAIYLSLLLGEKFDTSQAREIFNKHMSQAANSDQFSQFASIVGIKVNKLSELERKK